jgi:hypothetical protein
MMPNNREFLDDFLIAMPHFAGRIAMISAFFDESETADKSVFVVAGVLFDREGLETFTREWQRRTAALPGPYRTSHCATGRGAFSHAPWDKESCNKFMRGTAELIRDTYTAAMAVTIEPATVTAIWNANPKNREAFPGPYSLGVLECLHIASKWAERTEYDGEIDYLFESGAPGEPQAAAILARVAQNEELKARFRLGGRHFVSKDRAAALERDDFRFGRILS